MLQRHRQTTLVVATLVVLLVAAPLAPAADAADIDRFLERQMRKARVPGMSVAVLADGQLAWAEGYGWADIDNRVPVTPDTLFMIGSISKPVSATGVMWLHDRGLDLDEDVNGYLPFEVRNPSFPDIPITLRQLLTHTSSISDARSENSTVWWDIVSTDGDWPGSLTQFLIDYLTPTGRYYDPGGSFHDGAPGTRWDYSNVGYALVGAVVEQVTGGSFEDFQQAVLLGPLEMTESSWFLRDLDLDRVAVPYRWEAGSYLPYGHHGAAFFPAGMLRTSATQLSNFASLHLARGKYDGHRILERGTARQMMRVQFPEIAPNGGLGFGLEERGGTRRASHGGAFYGCTAFLWLDLDRNLGIIALTNGEPGNNFSYILPRQRRALGKIIDRLAREASRLAETD